MELREGVEECDYTLGGEDKNTGVPLFETNLPSCQYFK